MSRCIRKPAPVCGVILVEACVAIALMGLLLTMISLMVTRYSRAVDYYVNYRRVQLGAESQVERLRAGMLPIEADSFTDESGISYAVRVDDAPAQWSPLKHVVVTGRVTGKHSRRIQCELHAFVEYGPSKNLSQTTVGPAVEPVNDRLEGLSYSLAISSDTKAESNETP